MAALLTIKQVSKLTILSVGTLYHKISQGAIPAVRISSRCVRFRLSDLEKWIAEKVVLPLSPVCSATGKRGKKGAGEKTACGNPSGAQRHERQDEADEDE